jgi:Mn2+/Fe2+ NRAMP family transporter
MMELCLKINQFAELRTRNQELRKMADTQTPVVDQHVELIDLDALDRQPPVKRAIGYLKLLGPGYMQSAMTLGSGTVFASIFAGAAFGYELLWVPPVAMFLGIIVLSAVAHQTLSTGQNPFQAMKQHAGSFFAYGWGASALLASIIWHFAQYSLAAAMLAALAASLGWLAPNWIMGVLALIWSIAVTLMYGRTPRLVRLYESILKYMVWFIVFSLAYIVIKMGIPDPGAFVSGFIPSIPGENKGVFGITLAVSGLAAAVGVNMVFIYPYSLRERGWQRPHRRLARYDLFYGMWLPYSLAAVLLVAASASVFHFGDPNLFEGKGISAVQAAEVLAAPDRLGPITGMWIFGLGVVAMALSSISMQMLSAGYACGEMFGWKKGGVKYTIGMLLPAVGVLGSVFWNEIALWVAVPTNIICGFLLPLAYFGFIKLQRNRTYLGKDLPTGTKGRLWLGGMLLATIVLIVGLIMYSVKEGPRYLENFMSVF